MYFENTEHVCHVSKDHEQVFVLFKCGGGGCWIFVPICAKYRHEERQKNLQTSYCTLQYCMVRARTSYPYFSSSLSDAISKYFVIYSSLTRVWPSRKSPPPQIHRRVLFLGTQCCWYGRPTTALPLIFCSQLAQLTNPPTRPLWKKKIPNPHKEKSDRYVLVIPLMIHKYIIAIPVTRINHLTSSLFPIPI